MRHTIETKDTNKPDPDQDTVQYAGTSAGDTATRAETVHSSTMQNTQWISPQGPRTENKQTDPTGRRPAKTQATEMKNGQYPQTNQKEKEKGVEKVKKTWSTNYWQLWRNIKSNNQVKVTRQEKKARQWTIVRNKKESHGEIIQSYHTKAPYTRTRKQQKQIKHKWK